MDFTTIIGLTICIVAIIGSIIIGAPLSIFWDLPSVLIVGMGVIGTTMMKFPMDALGRVIKVTLKAFFFSPTDPKPLIDEIFTLAETARRESVFALEKVQIADTFLAKAMKLAADNRPPEVIQSILQMEISAMETRHKIGITMFEEMAADGPAMGMLGTLIGLVMMLQNLSDPSAIGPSMAVALLTTLYGAVIANVFCLPFKTKLNMRSGLEINKMNIIIAGTLGIVAGENPRLIKEKLESFLPPSQRSKTDEKAE
jgi:chemotaxis protein MotA